MKQNKSFSIYTDLAIEAKEMLGDSAEEEGIALEVEDEEGVKITWVKILNETGSAQMQKPIGNYVTIESDLIKENDIDAHERIIRKLSEKLGKLHNLSKDSTILVVGLGNWRVTPDALGPKVVSKLLVTRHILDSVPKEVSDSVRPLSAISPGVMGITGIETMEIVKGLVDRVKPDLVIAVDALAARRTNRINTTFQMTDTGINPGAGIGNKRATLSKETLGTNCIAIGVPTVVDAATLVNDTMDMMLNQMIASTDKGSEFFEMLKDLEDTEKYGLITEILNPYSGNMFVTPKEVDAVVERISGIIANSINIAVHTGITREDINRFMY